MLKNTKYMRIAEGWRKKGMKRMKNGYEGGGQRIEIMRREASEPPKPLSSEIGGNEDQEI